MNFFLEGFSQAFHLLISGNAETYSAILATMKVSSYSIGCSLVIGIPLGFCLGYFDFRWKRPVRTIVDTMMALPTVFIGLLVYAFLTHRGPLGDFDLLFTLPGIAIGQTILALPIVVGLSATAVESMDKKLRTTIMSLGANRRQLLWGAGTVLVALGVERASARVDSILVGRFRSPRRPMRRQNSLGWHRTDASLSCAARKVAPPTPFAVQVAD